MDVYFRRLPHLQPPGGTFFVTYRLHGTIPALVRNALIEAYEAERKQIDQQEGKAGKLDKLHVRYFGRYDTVLDQALHGATYLADERIAQLVVESLRHWHGSRIDLIAYCVMPNHVHVVFTMAASEKADKSIFLHSLMQSIKSFSARKANELLQRKGPFWAEESYDRLIRDNDELIRIVRYVLSNPVKAGLCLEWHDWRWSYVQPEYDMF